MAKIARETACERLAAMTRSPLGLVLITLGLVLLCVGILAWLGALSWFGRLPGDIRIERPGFRFYAPIVSMLVVSVVLSLGISLVRRLRP